MNNTVSSF